MNDYPQGTVRSLLETRLVTDTTRRVLRERIAADIENEDYTPAFFDAPMFATLRAVCARLIPQPERARKIDVAVCIDKRLACDMSDGWRYNTMPPDGEAYRLGLQALNASAQELQSVDFVRLDEASANQLLHLVRDNQAPGANWSALSPARFFEELLAEATESYYSHPLAQEEIGYAGMADADGWTRITLNDLEAWEPRANSVYAPEIEPAIVSEPVSEDTTESGNRPRVEMKKYATSESVDASLSAQGRAVRRCSRVWRRRACASSHSKQVSIGIRRAILQPTNAHSRSCFGMTND
jgi:hypothetical protein